MSRKNLATTVLLALTLLLTAGALSGCQEKPEEPEPEITEFGQLTENELFQGIPVLPKKEVRYDEVLEVGSGDVMIRAYGVGLQDYRDYLKVLEENGFEKVVDNGENGIEGYLYAADYRKEDLVLYVAFIARLESLTVTVNQGAELSEHLFFNESYLDGNVPGNRTSFHLMELKEAGNSFVLQLKNGHFVIFDGGKKVELPYLLEYLESLTPEGEKPFVDAWIISHPHADHLGVFVAFSENPDYVDRVSVQEVLFDPPENWMLKNLGKDVDVLPLYIKTVSTYMKAADGTPTKLYHPHLGERYYYSDFTIDVIYTMEILNSNKWDTSNSTCMVLMLTIEGQKVLLPADSDWCCQVVYTEMFPPEYFDLTVYQAPHHGINVYKQISNRLGKIRTIIYPTNVPGTIFGEGNVLSRFNQNKHLMSLAEEALAWGDGTKILRFPYEVGTAESVPQKFNVEDEPEEESEDSTEEEPTEEEPPAPASETEPEE